MSYLKIALACCLWLVFFLTFPKLTALLCHVCSFLFHSGVAEWRFHGITGVVYSRKATYLQSWTKLSWDTPWKRLVSLNAWVFQCLILTFRPPLPLKPGQSVHGAYCNIEKGERGCWLSTKRKIRKDADKKAFVLLKCVNTFVHDCLKLPFSENK